jgi:thiamine-monophosphate kinase
MIEAALLSLIADAVDGQVAPGVRLGIGDDAALLTVDSGHELAACADTLNVDTHFRADQPADSIGHRALAVNLSDLAAMGAQPRFALLSLSLPDADQDWIMSFMAGFASLARRYDVALVGGDTTRGPLSIAVTLLGQVPAGTALRRGLARVGDEIWVSGCLGGAAAALIDDAAPRDRLLYPEPRIALGLALRSLATAAIDLSDGLRVDLDRLLAPLGGVIDAAGLPVDPAIVGATNSWRLAVCGGDDYELCFTAPSEAREQVLAIAAGAGTAVTRIGEVTDSAPCRIHVAGQPIVLADLAGFEHFS